MSKLWKILGLTGLMLLGMLIGMVPFLVGSLHVNMLTVQRWMSFVVTITAFLLPALVFWKRIPLKRFPRVRTIIYLIEILIASVPVINLITWACMNCPLPESIKQLAESARFLQESQLVSMLRSHGVGESLWIILVIAVTPAVAEEFCFRGALLGILRENHPEKNSRYVHCVVWAVAFVFSIIHGDIYGIVPRMLLGALLGYLCVWTGSIWTPIIYHFMNNALVAGLNMLEINHDLQTKWIGEELGSGNTWYLGVLAIGVLAMLVWQLYKVNSQEGEE